ncbi:hypothetical protein [Cellulosimicrobium marinum]|uniref:hypothetical protein n=1 Tax=Cellulosimicrobium marinum TaxID=1638992 RepID=UPI001E4CB2CF|nr:hypothetical protein [Cellulosimicrobium marinum]MCB7138204.1 hypothetical protein [Cellulosimicrobium marinum]
MTTTRRLLAAVLLSAALTTTSGAVAGATTPAPPSSGDEGVRVTVEIAPRETGFVRVVGEGPFVAGGTLVVQGGGLGAGADHEVWLHSDPTLLATVETAADGTFELTATVPTDTVPGEHHVRVVATATGAEVTSEPFEVVAASDPQDPDDGSTGSAGGGTSASGGSGSLATTGAGLAGVALFAGVAVATGVALRRRAARTS